ncbi:HMCN1 [Branchiostoma lanceolatum]|uniref:HMCN1 protein n=1 Tax=Branchiostoma lanceolatum TaxID=7740 RepID=A0A8K0AH26_BRALA|nr:HMCN1 [Branchiostoma lanceolatum]
MADARLLCAAWLVLLVRVEAQFHPVSSGHEFPQAAVWDRILTDVPHRLLCHELCLKDVSCTSFQYNQTSRECRVSIATDALEDHPDDDVDDSLHDLPLDGLLPTAPHSDSGCYSDQDACISGQVCRDKCVNDGVVDCTCRSPSWARPDCKSTELGTWEDWGPWGDCSVSCGGGIKKRMRTCRDEYDGKTCVGRDTDVKLCAKKKCPEWTEWGGWTKCTRCGRSRTRTRTCPVPGHCPGPDVQKKSCMSSKECSTHIRLQRGLFVTDGWVEVWDQLNGYWRPLCGEWTEQNGRVACRHLGFKDVEVDTPHGVMNMGCFSDDPGDRDPADAWNTTLNGPSMTASSPQDCLAFCRLRGLKYAAIRDGNVCQCGRGYARNGEADPAACDAPCTDAENFTCGSQTSELLNDVYTYAPLGNIMYFPMDEKREETGELVGNPPAHTFNDADVVDGVVGKGLYLNGDNQWAKTDRLDGTCLGSTTLCPEGFTIGMWIKLMELPPSDRYFMSTGGHTRSSYGFNFYYDVPDGPGFWVTHRDAWCRTHFALPIGIWMHLSLSWKAPCDINIFVNSTEVDFTLSKARPSDLEEDVHTTLAIGGPNTVTNVAGIAGHITVDEVRFWDRKVTGKELHEVIMHDLRMSGIQYHPQAGAKVMKGEFKCTGEELLLGMCDHEEDSSLADDICGTSTQNFVHCVPNGWWDSWSSWSSCIDGQSRRTRKCYTPSPHYQGNCADSPGPGEQVKSCVFTDI